MDQTKHQIPQTLSQFKKPLFLKKITQLLLSVSVFFFLFSYSSWLSFLLHSFNFYFSAFPFQLFSYTLDRTCIFLLCNGILVFLARNSGLITSFPSGSDHTDEFFKRNGDDSPSGSLISETKVLLLDKELVMESPGPLEKAVLEEETRKLILEGEEQETESEFLKTDEREEEEEEETVAENEKEEKDPESDFFIEDEEEEQEELLNSEELNQKFDDFIRRMKEEIRIEAQQHPILVK